MFAAIKVPYTPVVNSAKGATNHAERTNWTYTEWSKKDPAGLAELQKMHLLSLKT